METDKFQKKCFEVVEKIDKKYGTQRDSHLCFAQMMEEIGELAKEINSPKIRGKEIDRDNLKGEFADVFLLLMALAKIYDIDFEEVVENKIKILNERHKL